MSEIKRTYQQAVSYQKFCWECGVDKLEMYDDVLLATTNSGLKHRFCKEDVGLFRGMVAIVREGNAP